MFDKRALTKFDFAWTGLNIDKIQTFLDTPRTFNPFEDKHQDEIENKGLREILLMYDPDYIYYTAKILLGVELYPLQCAVLKMLWTHAFPMLIGSRGFSKSYLLAVYSLLRAILFPGTKIVIAGAAFRQSKYVFEYAEGIYRDSRVLQSIFKSQSKVSEHTPDFWNFRLGDSKIIAIPLGTGDKIRGLRANITICDEMNSVNTEIYEVVISQFAAVSMNPIENMKQIAKRKAMATEGLILAKEKSLSYFSNQSVIAGTMKYEFEPMAIYWRKYKDIIESKGKKLSDEFGDVGDNLNWRDFAVARIPYELIPEGFMDDKIVARAKSTMHSEFYKAEYGACPISDSMGFFRRTLIESCVAKNSAISRSEWPGWCPEAFDAIIHANRGKNYVMGIDPAYNQDNLAIVILEAWPEHSRIVYVWSTSKKSFEKDGKVDEQNYFAFCARKVRDLMATFPCLALGIDTQGGGYALIEALNDRDKMKDGELPIYPVINFDKPQDTDGMTGLHHLHLIQFADSVWTATANHGMKKDMEDKVLLFPQFNSMLLGLASERDARALKEQYAARDTLEECMLEIEELKDELSLIIRSTTVSNRERWDTPEIKVTKNKKDRMRKDRYSALLIANTLSRGVHRALPAQEYPCVGGVVGNISRGGDNGRMYVGPDWYNPGKNFFRGIRH